MKDYNQGLESSSKGKPWGNSLSFSTKVDGRVATSPNLLFSFLCFSLQQNLDLIALDIFQLLASFPFLLFPCFKVPLPLFLFSLAVHYFLIIIRKEDHIQQLQESEPPPLPPAKNPLRTRSFILAAI